MKAPNPHEDCRGQNNQNGVSSCSNLEVQHHANIATELFLTERQLAIRWQVSEKKLQSERLSGQGCQYLGLNRLIRYRLSDVRAFEEARLRISTSTPVHET
jgi:hypothetical protein